MNSINQMPEWYQELRKEIDFKPKNLSPEKKIVIDYLKECIKRLEND